MSFVSYYYMNKYEPIGEIHSQRCATLKSIISSVLMAGVAIGMIVAFWTLVIDANRMNVLYVDLDDVSQNHTTSDKFLSFGIDSSLLRKTKCFPLRDAKFISLAKHLSPAYVRIGGTAADCLYFNKTMQRGVETCPDVYNPHNITNFSISGEDFITLNKFSQEAELRMIFDLNVLRRVDNRWDSSNAKEIISFAKEKNFDLDWQLGNEPNSFMHVFHQEISALQLAEDYKVLRQILNENGYENSATFGPETNHIGDAVGSNGVDYAEEFFANAGNSVNFLTWHQYYLNGREATVKDFVNVTVFDFLPKEIEKFNEIFTRTKKRLPTCLSETSTAYGGGAPDLSDRFVAGFLWLDKLGYSASAGLKVVIRQSFYGGNYAMVGPDLQPNPDWWISVAYKHFVSEKVLHFKTEDPDKNLRLYAHCTPERARLNRVPAATVYGVNLNRYDKVNIALGGKYDRKRKMFVYVFTADSLRSREIRLNGDILQLRPDGALPPFDPSVYTMDEVVSLPPLSMFFIVVHGVKIAACSS